MKSLRAALRVSISDFGRLLGMSLPVVQSRELQKVPWKLDEISNAKAMIGKHLMEAGHALDALDFRQKS